MKRVQSLFDRIHERENLRHAAHAAMKRKRAKVEARLFAANLEQELKRLSDEIRSGSLVLGQHHQFWIRDPKERLITAPCFRERVLHHAMLRVCEPTFERRLIPDTYACRVGKGRIAALLRAKQFSSRFGFYLKLDIRKYFPSIPHHRLGILLKRLFAEPRMLALWSQVVTSYCPETKCGLPIGSLTSQHLANAYLGQLDRVIKEGLRVKGYVRYMDDMVLWAESSEALSNHLQAITEFLQGALGLEVKAPYINRIEHGIGFLGARVFPNYIAPSRSSRIRYRRRIRNLERLQACGGLSEMELQRRGTAMTANMRVAGMCSWMWRRRVVDSYDGE
jgi:retron-type reverse transcriptase